MTQRYEIDNLGTRIFVHGPRELRLDQAAKALGGKIAKDHYSFPGFRAEAVAAIVAEIEAAYANITPAAPAAPTAPTVPTANEPQQVETSKPRRSHPLGRAIRSETGCTVYADDTFGGGAVRIYDES
jgi:hypothetical protein